MSSDIPNVVALLLKLLQLDVLDQGLDSNPEAHLTEILSDFGKTFENLHAYIRDLTLHVEIQLFRRFKLNNTADNFNITDSSLWCKLLNCTKEQTVLALALQIILSLASFSIINKQRLGQLFSLKDELYKSLSSAHQEDSLVQSRITELYTTILGVNCEPQDLINLYTRIPEPHSIKILNCLITSACDILSHTHLQFENIYKTVKFNYSKHFYSSISLHLIVEFNNVSSNRFLTLGQNLYLEIKDGKLCVTNDEFTEALFDEVEFDSGTSYSLTATLQNGEFSLFVNGTIANSIALLSNIVLPLERIEIGSMLCSFKLYRLYVWSDTLPHEAIKIIHELKSIHIDCFETPCNLEGVRRSFGDALLRKTHAYPEFLHDPYECFLSNIKKWDTCKVLLDFSPVEEISLSSNNDFCISFENWQRSDTGNSKCYYFKASQLVPMFRTVDCIKLILFELETIDSIDTSFEYVVHLLKLLQVSVIRKWFEEDYNYTFLGYLMRRIVTRFKQGLPIQFLNIFLEAFGWDFNNIDKSIIENTTAYNELILNQDLWYYPGVDNSIGAESTEVIRYIYFHLNCLLNDSYFSTYNLGKLQDLDLLRHLNFYHLMNCYIDFNVMAEDSSNICITLLKAESNMASIHWLLCFIYFQVQKSDLKGAQRNLKIIDRLLSSEIKSEKSPLIKGLSLKHNLMILDEIVKRNGDPVPMINIILKLLLINEDLLSKFLQNGGSSIFLGILRVVGEKYHVPVTDILFFYSLGKSYISTSTTFTIESYIANNPNVIILVPEFICIALRLVELWTPNSPNEFELDTVNDNVTTIWKNLRLIISSADKKTTSGTWQTLIVVSLLDVLPTLRKYQNHTIYKSVSELTSIIIVEVTINSILRSKNHVFHDYLINSLALRIPHRDHIHHHLEPAEAKYIELGFSSTILPALLKSLIRNERQLVKKIISQPYFLPNIMCLLKQIEPYMKVIEFEIDFYLHIYKLLLICVDTYYTEHETLHSHVSESVLSSVFSFNITVIFYSLLMQRQNWKNEELSDFYRNTLLYQRALLQRKKGAMNNQLVCFLLLISSSELICNGYNKLIMHAVRALLLFHDKDLQNIASFFDHSNKGLLVSKFLEILSSSDDSAMSCLLSIQVNICGETQREKMKMLVIERMKCQNDPISLKAEHLFNEILRRKQISHNKINKSYRSIYELFEKDNQYAHNYTMTLMDKEYTYYMNDREEDLMMQKNKLHESVSQLKHSNNLQQLNQNITTWMVDTTVNMDYMRRRLTPFYGLEAGNINVSERETSDVIFDTSVRRNSNTSFISYDMVLDVDFADTSDVEKNENRKVLKLLKGDDVIRGIWNCSLIFGIEIKEGVLILGDLYLYFVSGYFYSKDQNKVLNVHDVAPTARDINVTLITGEDNKIASAKTMKEHYYWDIQNLAFVTKRPFLLRDVAMEILFNDESSRFLSFKDKTTRNKVFQSLDPLSSPEGIEAVLSGAIKELNIQATSIGLKNGIAQNTLFSRFSNVFTPRSIGSNGFEVTELWQKGKISNFFYLMMINILAGRSFNDLTQYPVFPWVIADYTSDELDLGDPKTYRDLSKPMGAQSEERKNQFIDRFHSLRGIDDAHTPPFHYGTHYSSAMIVLGYLIRLKPFTDSFLILQGGSFGHPDRLFSSIERSWSSAAIESTTDVRELTPEFFYLPEFLVNINKVDFGQDQNGNTVNDVQLPPWAKNDPKIFIAKNREALESPYVSEHLNEWIDLIFGYKQRGEMAINEVNVFNRLSYPGAVNLEKIANENERRAITGIIHNFGQTPLQLFEKPHPKRLFLKNEALFKFQQLFDRMRKKVQLLQPNAAISNGTVEYLELNEDTSGNEFWRGYKFLDVQIEKRHSKFQIKLVSSSSILLNSCFFKNVHLARITSFAISKLPIFITGDENGLLSIWKFTDKEGSLQLSKVANLCCHLHEIKKIKACNNYNTLLTLDVAGQVYSWDMNTYQPLRKMCSNASDIALSQINGTIAILTTTCEVQVYNLNAMHYGSFKIEPRKMPTALEFLECIPSKTLPNHTYLENYEPLCLGYSDGSVEICQLKQLDRAWTLIKMTSFFTGKTVGISSLKCVYRARDAQSQNEQEPLIELLVSDHEGNIYIWN
ncbi:hypothetical protein KAFR_0G00260 [Kazachstania africana CBS 2517]|uniref:Beige protein homolog 1 n=1 Tax=Kazachstania africana (strain ATCC 22294 / BCRC 22015 / CBS 2517 / CECT 1963 / NBRC 1671 / NRRL Y-8276) TaxID=1071382 RepID=H2AXF9_KAZAF|nr:hypothetical protein KAFR_0G00260 [Kazachstania africana CBS 2517]CCF59059.1 hypothetical protein KAFR_0G00260 [Kazachstania africana CBS 2517]